MVQQPVVHSLMLLIYYTFNRSSQPFPNTQLCKF